MGGEWVPAAFGPLADFLPAGLDGLQEAARQTVGMVANPRSGFHLFAWLAGLTTLYLLSEARKRRRKALLPAAPSPEPV